MKISAFHLMPHRELPPDFEQRYESVWVTPPWWELADARRVGQYYNWTLDELLYAARALPPLGETTEKGLYVSYAHTCAQVARCSGAQAGSFCPTAW
jgi:hypothetical protein